MRTLQNAIEGKRIHHAYLFSGVRGVGKTTSARILAKALNCVQGPDGGAGQQMHDLPGDHRGDRSRRPGDRCGDLYRGRQRPRAARRFAVPAGARPLSASSSSTRRTCSPRRSWNALLKIHRGTAAARDLHVRHHRAAKVPHDDPLARAEARACGRSRWRTSSVGWRRHRECGGHRSGRRRWRSSPAAAKAACATRCRSSIRSSPSAAGPSPDDRRGHGPRPVG